MAESTLSVSRPELLRRVGLFLGWGRDPANWTADQTTDGDDIVNAGYRKFLYPPLLPDQKQPYEWSFLKPYATLATANTDFDYDLADDFGFVCGDFTFASAVANHRVVKIEADLLLTLRAKATASGPPRYFATRAKTSTGTTGQRWEAIFYPTPDATYTLNYSYTRLPDKLTAGNPYPLGGLAHGDTIIAAVLAAAEEYLDDDAGVHAQKFLERLAASIRFDERLYEARA